MVRALASLLEDPGSSLGIHMAVHSWLHNSSTRDPVPFFGLSGHFIAHGILQRQTYMQARCTCAQSDANNKINKACHPEPPVRSSYLQQAARGSTAQPQPAPHCPSNASGESRCGLTVPVEERASSPGDALMGS